MIAAGRLLRFEQLIDGAVEGGGGAAFKSTGDGKLATMPTVLSEDPGRASLVNRGLFIRSCTEIT